MKRGFWRTELVACCMMVKRRSLAIKVIVGLLVVLLGVRGALAQGLPRVNANALLVLRSNDLRSLQTFLKKVEAEGGRIDHVFPPNAIIGYVPEQNIGRLRGGLPGLRIARTLPEASAMAEAGEPARVAAFVWQALQSQSSPLPTKDVKGSPTSPPNDARIAPDRRSPYPLGKAQPLSSAPGFLQTSEYLIGSVVVGILTPESNGAIDPNSENWSAARQNTVVANIATGLQWWKDNFNAPSNLTFVYDIHHSVPTSYEPIRRSSADEDLWISQVMTNVGYPGSSSTYFTQVRQYLNDKRAAMGTDWAFAIFVVDSLNDADGQFANGDFAYTYVNGPFMVMTYDNDGWGISKMPIIVAHEHGHMWGALDEYASSGCTDAETSGYLNIANTNCENGSPATEDSIMRGPSDQELVAYPNHLVSTPARQMVGWRDSDGDGKEFYDPVDTIPAVTLNPFSPDPTTNPIPTYTGSAHDVPFPSSTTTPTTINKIVNVEWRVDLGPWHSATASDSAFDSDIENFTFTSTPLTSGNHTFDVRAINSAGNISSVSSDTLAVSIQPTIVTITAANPTATEANLTDGVFTISRTGSTTQPLTVTYTVSGTASPGSDYLNLSGSVTIPAGASSADILVMPIDNIVAETNETVVVTLSASSSYTVGAQNSAVVTIVDNDAVNPTAHVDCLVGSLQATLDLAPPGSTIFVSGTCNENVLVDNNKIRVFLQGNGATLFGQDPNKPALDIRGKAIFIGGLTVTGVGDGIVVQRGSNVVMDGNVIAANGGDGVVVNQLAFAVLTNNTIQNNAGDGVIVADNATAHIGFNNETETVASPNLIQGNEGFGVVVGRSSSARIIGNTISGNTNGGVMVVRDSHADIASNIIDGNSGDGVLISDNSTVSLGEDSGSTIYDLPNSTNASNAGFGVHCMAGGVADGRRGTLNGASGPMSFDSSCITNDLSP